jgi:hypothetical protein
MKADGPVVGWGGDANGEVARLASYRKLMMRAAKLVNCAVLFLSAAPAVLKR